jgi:hypothetical protein
MVIHSVECEPRFASEASELVLLDLVTIRRVLRSLHAITSRISLSLSLSLRLTFGRWLPKVSSVQLACIKGKKKVPASRCRP